MLICSKASHNVLIKNRKAQQAYSTKTRLFLALPTDYFRLSHGRELVRIMFRGERTSLIDLRPFRISHSCNKSMIRVRYCRDFFYILVR